VFLVLFSYAFFFEGFTGLTITVGAIITLFVLMQMTARVSWDEVFSGSALRRAEADRG
jgi:NADH:ubiquinone oxidoreductase subunit 6 (subunit J)